MTKIPARVVPIAVLAGGLTLASCARPGGAIPANPAAGPNRSAAIPAVARAPHKPRPVWPARAPTLGIASPMKGEPPTSSLKEARLVQTTCKQASRDEIESTVREMHRALDAAFKEWHDEQPSCWRTMREDDAMKKESEVVFRSAQSLGNATGNMWGGGAGRPVAKAPAARPAPSSAPGRTEAPRKAESFSGTNNQIATVDEADIVKTDGSWVYLAQNGALRIIEAMKPRVVSTTPIGGITREMFVEGNRAVVYSSFGTPAERCTYGYDCQVRGDGTSTKVTVFDIEDRAHPKKVRELTLSGSLIAARRVGSAVHTVTADDDSERDFEVWPDDFEMCGVPEAKVRAQFARLRAENERRIRAKTAKSPTVTENGKAKLGCEAVYQTASRDAGAAFTSVVSFDLANDKGEPSMATMKSRPGAVFASSEALYVAVVRQKTAGRGWYSFYPTVEEVTEIHKFAIGARAKETRYVGSGTVPGHVLNQFAMDEWYGYLRVATTKGHVPDPGTESTLSVLAEAPGGNLTRIGAVSHLAPGEDIRSVRFDGDRGYIVTFKKTDPLFVLDLFEPARPQVVGELKIPGFSTYMHRIDPDHLLSIGFDANDHGDFAFFDGVILQLFDVKNPKDPRLVHKEKIGTRGSSSAAATNHLAFNYHAKEGLLAIPMTICEGGGDGVDGGDLTFSGLLVYDVDLDRGFTRLGGIDHGTRGASCGVWWSSAKSHVQRSVFLDELVYSIAPDRVKVQQIGRFGTDVANLPLGTPEHDVISPSGL